MEKRAQEFQTLLEEKQFAQIRVLANECTAADMAAAMEVMENETMLRIFRLLPKDQAADVVAYFEPDD